MEDKIYKAAKLLLGKGSSKNYFYKKWVLKININNEMMIDNFKVTSMNVKREQIHVHLPFSCFVLREKYQIILHIIGE